MKEEIEGKLVEYQNQFELEHGKKYGVFHDFLSQFTGMQIKITVETIEES